ncbi:acetylornithine transaminase [Homoserinibacter sp. GY 40078]|uniref:acetylornithine transaminase n=1 Tax=Homoserinibacter sp. GY 40078 TaxID=2603275 RepID=UPI0011CC0808|nr:acetylornithine transaminase [Homoserinibacter sp. GY 40078]TXK20072.1 acetylornithine transaminase [Homoserinibacter sp. GY 40078]
MYTEVFSRVMMRSAPAPLKVLARGEGARVWDVDGADYLDFLAGIAVNALGHAHPAFVGAVADQAATLAHVSNYFATPPQLELAERLTRLTGGSRVFLCNSGAEAIEAAVKLARLTGKPRILALENAFHGRTIGSLSLTGKPALRAPFEPLLPGVEHLPTSLDALEAALAAGDVAALVLEPIKGEAGVVELPEGYLAGARELTERHGALLILDEIQTGAGRTGDWFAYQHEGIVPDAVALAKGIGGGFPIGALVTFGAASDLFGPGHHGSTFGGNPLAARVANAVLGEIEDAGLVENARRRGAELRARIELIGSPLVTDIQGRGLLLGIGLAEPVAGIVARRALDEGLIVNAANESRIRLAPPLIIGDDELHEFTRKFTVALEIPHTDPGEHA